MESNTKGLSVGSDPEFMLRDSSNNLIPSFGLLGGTKANPIATAHGAIQEDNVTAEVNSMPAGSLSEFIDNHRLIIQDLKDILDPLNLHIDITASATFPDKLLSHPLARVAGCEPDFDAWSLTQNIPASYLHTNLRAAGGHLHIGFKEAKVSPRSRLDFVKALDLELGVPSVILDPDEVRRTLYGSAGSHRPKFKRIDGFDGIEYRVLSNFWTSSEELLRFVYSKIEYVNDNLYSLSAKAESLKDEIIYLVNQGNSHEATIFCKKNGVAYAS